MARLSLMVVFILSTAICNGTDDRLGHCSETVSPQDSNLKVTLGPGAKSHICNREPDVITFSTMMSQCSSYCGSKGISVLLGTESSGFNLSSLDSLCVGAAGGDSLLVHNDNLVTECERSTRSIDNIKFRVADFIASVRNITYSQQLFKAAMIDKVKALQTEMFSAKTKEDMDLASVNAKMQKLQQILKNSLADVMKTGVLSLDLRKKTDTLQAKANMLSQVMSDELPRLQQFVNECNQLVLGTGTNGEYLLDICSVTSDQCIDVADGRHVGCCCGIIPAAGIFSITGSVSASAGGRRLNAGEESDIDACGKAYEISQPEVDQIVADIQATSEGTRILQEFDTAQKAKYSDFYTNCDTRRLEGEEATNHDGDASPQRVRDDGERNWLAGDDPDHDVETSFHRSSGDSETPRDLQGLYLTCQPPSAPTDSTNINGALKVAFADTTEEALCKNIPGMTDEKLAQMCQDFCAPTAVPFLLGSLTYGFNHADMDDMCLKPDDDYFDQAKVTQCHAQANAFNDLQDKTAVLVEKLEILENAKLLFEAKAKKAGTDLQNLLISQAATTVDDEIESQKLQALKELVSTGLADFMGTGSGTVRTDVKETAEAVKAAADQLQTTLQDVIPKLQDFIQNCNLLMTGVGQSKEYLLDMCSQDSKACIGAAEGKHVGCCCGYNPIVSLGTDATDATIDGIKATSLDVGNARINRRLSTAGTVNICGEASKKAKSQVADYKSQIESIDSSVWVSKLESKKAKYPVYYGRCSQPAYGSGAPSNTAAATTLDSGVASNARERSQIILNLLLWLCLSFATST